MTLIRKIREDRYYILLFLEIALIMTLPFLEHHDIVSSAIIAGLLSLILIAGINTLENRKLHRYSWWVVALFIVLTTTHSFKPFPQLYFLSYLLFFGMLVIVDIGIIRMLLWAKNVKPSFIAGSVAGYLLIGLNLAFFIIAINGIVDFNALSKPIDEIGFQGVLYFSLTTMTTIGYGDIAPVAPMVQMVSALTGVLSQFYIAVVVAVIVSKLLSSKQNQ